MIGSTSHAREASAPVRLQRDPSSSQIPASSRISLQMIPSDLQASDVASVIPSDLQASDVASVIHASSQAPVRSSFFQPFVRIATPASPASHDQRQAPSIRNVPTSFHASPAVRPLLPPVIQPSVNHPLHGSSSRVRVQGSGHSRCPLVLLPHTPRIKLPRLPPRNPRFSLPDSRPPSASASAHDADANPGVSASSVVHDASVIPPP